MEGPAVGVPRPTEAMFAGMLCAVGPWAGWLDMAVGGRKKEEKKQGCWDEGMPVLGTTVQPGVLG